MENFVQAIFDSIQPKGFTLVVGGDGRYFSPGAIQIVVKIATVNDVAKFIIGANSILSTPAASNIIRKYKADGGILCTSCTFHLERGGTDRMINVWQTSPQVSGPHVELLVFYHV